MNLQTAAAFFLSQNKLSKESSYIFTQPTCHYYHHAQTVEKAIPKHRQVPKQSKRDSLGDKQHYVTWVGLARLRQSHNTELQFNINSIVKCSHFWCSVETDEGALDTDNHSQLRISATLVFNILYKTQTNAYHKRAEEKMTLPLILPKIYLLKCHLQENKTDTLSFLHLHLKQAQEHL